MQPNSPNNSSNTFFSKFKNFFVSVPEQTKTEGKQINPKTEEKQINPKAEVEVEAQQIDAIDYSSTTISEEVFKPITEYHKHRGIHRTLRHALLDQKEPIKTDQKEIIISTLNGPKTINLYDEDESKKKLLLLFAYKPASTVPDREAKSTTLMLRGDLPLTKLHIDSISTFVKKHQLSKARFFTAVRNADDTRLLTSFRGGMKNEEIDEYDPNAFLPINIAEHLSFLKLAHEIKEEFNALKSKLIEGPIDDITQEAILKNYQDFEKCFVLSIHPTELKNGLVKFKDELTTLKDKPTEFIDACDSSIKKIEALLKKIDQGPQIRLSPSLKPF